MLTNCYCIRTRMKYRHILLILFCICLASTFRTEEVNAAESENICAEGKISTLTEENMVLSEPDNEFSLPRQNSYSPVPRCSSQNRRNNTSTCWSPLVKSGKVINITSSGYSTDNQLLFPSGLSDDTHHLISLRKLII